MNKQGTGKRIVAWLIDFLIYFWAGIFLLYAVYGFEYERLVDPSIKNAYKKQGSVPCFFRLHNFF